MKKNYFLLLFGLLCFSGKTIGQQVKPCGTDEMRKQMIATHPEMLKYEAELEAQIKNGLKKIDYTKAAKTTSVDESGDPNFWYDIPIVIHFVHDYGPEFLPDDTVITALKDWNIVYADQNYDTANVIPVFRKYIGNVHIRLHLATIDPSGNPTKGITRHRSYLTYTGGEQSKFDDWPNTSYVNIWVVRLMSTGNQEAAAYAFQPAGGASNPVGDGIITLYDYFRDAYDGMPNAVSKTIPHEMGHVFNLQHPWGNTNNPDVACGDDGVDDTPPTKGHNPVGCSPAALYDTACAENYFKIYTDVHGNDSLVNYPDTTNSQNIMDYTYCARMFTKGQVARMHAALNSDVAGRNNLWDSTNLVRTGALAAYPDLKPIPEFSATVPTGTVNQSNYMDHLYYFVFPGTNSPVTFHNETWRDTLTSLQWSFSNSASPSTSTSKTTVPAVTFNDGGWVDIKMTATGNGTGDTTVDFTRSVYVANPTATSAAGYYGEFNGADTAQWPMFNYYNNEFKWQLNNSVGFWDHNCVMYNGFDSRIDLLTGTPPFTGQPTGDVDDLFSIPLDLSSFSGGPCSLNFHYSGASRSSVAVNITDTLIISYATGRTNNWTQLAELSQRNLCNKGAVPANYIPTSPDDWALFSINLPAAARTPYTVFRFRYKPNTETQSYTDPSTGRSSLIPSSISSGNNFYMDRFTINPWPAGVGDIKIGDIDAVVAPNPTANNTYVIVKDMDNTTAHVVVTDVTGKQVYATSEQVTGHEAHILIPHAAISVPGMYLVQVTTGNQARTQKLIVE